MACKVMASVVIASVVMASVVMASVVLASVVMAYIVTATSCFAMAYKSLAYIVIVFRYIDRLKNLELIWLWPKKLVPSYSWPIQLWPYRCGHICGHIVVAI